MKMYLCGTLFFLVFTGLDILYSKQFLGKNYSNIQIESIDNNFGIFTLPLTE